MATYIVHSAESDGSDAVFVRQGFRVLAFAFAPIWLLAHRLWFAFLIWIAAALAIGALVGSGVLPPVVGTVLNVLIALFVGLESGGLISSRLVRINRREVAVLTAGKREEAEARFFSSVSSGVPPAGALNVGSIPSERSGSAQSIIGLFPEVGR